MPTSFIFRPNPVHYLLPRPNTPGTYHTTYYKPIYHTRMGNTASSQPVQSNVQVLVIRKTEMAMLNLHNNTLTYILVCLGIAVVLGILIHFYRKSQSRGGWHVPWTQPGVYRRWRRNITQTSISHNNHSHTQGRQNQYHRWCTWHGSTTRTLPCHPLSGPIPIPDHHQQQNRPSLPRLGEVPRSRISRNPDAHTRHWDSFYPLIQERTKKSFPRARHRKSKDASPIKNKMPIMVIQRMNEFISLSIISWLQPITVPLYE